MVDILTAVLIDGLPAVEAACAEALAEGVHSADEQRDPVAQVPDLFEVGFPRAGVVKRGSMPPSLALRALAQAFARGEIWLHVLDALAADDIDTDCNGVITMADLTVTMTTTRRLSQEEIEALIDLRIAQLRVLAAQTAVEWWRSRERERDERIRRLPLTRGRSWACVGGQSLGITGIRPSAGRASGAISC